MADVTDLALLKSKAKQEGLMFSVMETSQSIVQAVVGFLINWHLDKLGYVNAGASSLSLPLLTQGFGSRKGSEWIRSRVRAKALTRRMGHGKE